MPHRCRGVCFLLACLWCCHPWSFTAPKGAPPAPSLKTLWDGLWDRAVPVGEDDSNIGAEGRAKTLRGYPKIRWGYDGSISILSVIL